MSPSKEYKRIEIRPATESDVDVILAITKEAFSKYAYDLGQPQLVQALSDDRQSVLNDIRTKHVFVASLAGETVGTIRFENKANTGFISRFGVVLKAQSCGVGRALIQRVLDECRALGIPAVTLHTSARMSSLIRFYYGQGFFIRCTNTSRGYVRALLVRELTPDCGDVDVVTLQP